MARKALLTQDAEAPIGRLPFNLGFIMLRIFAVLLVSFVASCASVRPDPGRPPKLETGITSSNGGGARALGNQPNVGVTTRTAPAQ